MRLLTAEWMTLATAAMHLVHQQPNLTEARLYLALAQGYLVCRSAPPRSGSCRVPRDVQVGEGRRPHDLSAADHGRESVLTRSITERINNVW